MHENNNTRFILHIFLRKEERASTVLELFYKKYLNCCRLLAAAQISTLLSYESNLSISKSGNLHTKPLQVKVASKIKSGTIGWGH